MNAALILIAISIGVMIISYTWEQVTTLRERRKRGARED